MSNKDSIITNLLKKDIISSNSTGKPLISEIGSPSAPSSQLQQQQETEQKPNVLPPPANDGPSMLELMMEAHKSAVVEKKTSTAKINEAESKKSFGGFKKGFFSSNEKPKQISSSKQENSSKVAPTSMTSKSIQIQSVTELKAQSGQTTKSTLVLDDVQQAMEEEQHPMLKQLRSQGKLLQNENLFVLQMSFLFSV
jgi:hypothetical protein